MAHIVKCPYCKEQFDRDKIAYIIEGRRYAHVECVEAKAKTDADKEKIKEKIVQPEPPKPKEKELTPEQKSKLQLDEYINHLYNTEFVNPGIQKQIKSYVKDYNYTYSGILKSLVYFYEVKHNPVDQKSQTIGIVPYVYKQAFDYYYAIWLAQQRNENKNINDYIPEEREIVIPRPKARPHKRRMFSFLDKDGE